MPIDHGLRDDFSFLRFKHAIEEQLIEHLDAQIRQHAKNPKSSTANRGRLKAERTGAGKELKDVGERIEQAFEAISTGVNVLFDLANADSSEAAKRLTTGIIHACLKLMLLEKAKPELTKLVAQDQTLWPLLTRGEPGWEKKAVRRVAKLNLGEGLGMWRTRFRNARGSDANLPARRWAKAAVRTIESTRMRYALFHELVKNTGSAENLAVLCEQGGWEFGERPAWVEGAAKLSTLSPETLPAWKAVIRRLIREEKPDFHAHDDWITQRNTAKASGRDTLGEIQNAILDDIMSALSRIVPRE